MIFSSAEAPLYGNRTIASSSEARRSMSPMWISFFTTIAVRVPLAYLFAYLTRSAEYPNGNPISVFASLLCSWVIGCLINIIAYRRGKWRTAAKTKKA